MTSSNQSEPTDFEVMKRMADEKKELFASFNNNIKSMSYDHKKGSLATIYINDEVAMDSDDKYFMACYFVNKEEFLKTKQEMMEQ